MTKIVPSRVNSSNVDPFFRPLLEGRVEDIFDSFFDSFFNTPHSLGIQGTFPKMDVVTTENAIVFKVACPGISKDKINIDLSENVDQGQHRLTISGKYEDMFVNGNSYYNMKELKHSTFSRSVMVPETVDLNSIDAEMNNGILTISFKLKEEHRDKNKAKQIIIK